jgi:polysaccharide biosynthesis PFTS motif protein
MNLDISSDNQNQNFFSWIINKFYLSKEIIFFHCNKSIINKKINQNKTTFEINFIKDPIILFFDFSNFKLFIKSLIKTLFFSIKVFLSQRIELFFLLKEIFIFNYLKNLSDHKFYKYCLFNNSNMVFRPLWTYVNEKKIKGSVILYFYSINLLPLLHEIEEKKYYENYGYSLHSWPTYIVWSKEHKNWLQDNINVNRNFFIEKFIPFSERYPKLVKKNKTVIIFDVAPKKPQIYYQLKNPYNIYDLDYCQKFINDIVLSFNKTRLEEFDLVIKLKRDYFNIDPRYKFFLDKLIETKKLKVLKNIAPESALDIADATISIPFTTPAVISLNKNIEAIYYDPSGKLTKKNSLEKRINLISKKNELENWILKI